MATFTVTTTSDLVDANDGQLSLREALGLADADPTTADTIDFAPAVQGGRIVLGGVSSTDVAVVRYLADGTLDTSFSGDGKQIVDISGSSDEAFGLALQADGKIVQVGSANIAGTLDFAVLRYNTDGSLDTGFGGTLFPYTTLFRSRKSVV